MNEGNIYTFEIPHCLATDAGRYVVMASNSEGSERYSVSLMVKELESSEASDFRSLLKSRSVPRFGLYNLATVENVLGT